MKYEQGEALEYLGELGSGIQYLQQAVQTYREALAALPEDGPPEMRKDIQESLNDALEDLHQRGWNSG